MASRVWSLVPLLKSVAEIDGGALGVALRLGDDVAFWTLMSPTVVAALSGLTSSVWASLPAPQAESEAIESARAVAARAPRRRLLLTAAASPRTATAVRTSGRDCVLTAEAAAKPPQVVSARSGYRAVRTSPHPTRPYAPGAPPPPRPRPARRRSITRRQPAVFSVFSGSAQRVQPVRHHRNHQRPHAPCGLLFAIRHRREPRCGRIFRQRMRTSCQELISRTW